MNLQLAEKPVHREDGFLDVVNIWETIQGEGPYAGVPAVFVRTAGCDIQCGFCDTDYTTGRQLFSVPVLMEKVQSLRKTGLVVLTGGEPLRQNIGPFVEQLLANGYQVQLETNGTLCPDGGVPYGRISIVCSPKSPTINPRLEPYITAYKYVIEANKVDPNDGLPTQVLGDKCYAARPRAGFDKSMVFIMPCDNDNKKANEQEAVNSCLRYGFRLTLQLHKYLGLE